jgi:hypothetical protein
MEGSSLLVEEVKIVNKCQKLLESQQYIYHDLDANFYFS